MLHGSRFVCAFRGRRDDYQMPLALCDGQLLHRLVTDFYSSKELASLARRLNVPASAKLSSRVHEDLPSRLVRQVPGVAWSEFLARKDPRELEAVRDHNDEVLSKVAAQCARVNRSHLFLYSPNASAAFESKYSHDPARIVFQFHPHYAAEHSMLVADDQRLGPRLSRLENGDTAVRPHRLRSDSAWQMADHIVCASSFTARTLMEVGADPKRITVVGYGVGAPSEIEPSPAPQTFKVLFVGSGVQRKGIHHLIEAWRRAMLPPESTLTLVTRSLDRSLIDLRNLPNGVILSAGLSQRELVEMYRNSILFCMPSLIEGFGQVYLEALSNGLPVLGTGNTCLPDIGGEADGVFLTSPGDVDELASELERLSLVLPGNNEIRSSAAKAATRQSWASFRESIRRVSVKVAGIGI